MPQHENGPVGLVRHHTVTEYRRGGTAFAVAYRPLTESFGGPILLHEFVTPPSDISFPRKSSLQLVNSLNDNSPTTPLQLPEQLPYYVGKEGCGVGALRHRRKNEGEYRKIESIGHAQLAVTYSFG
ncbi:hypothetical protein EVAR_47907_1 [Eumeta japonica]|uniref:Uncharacterized protein n=1 Tax=Eumeta variegata TaxID=151549 RepID=A0A4C1Y6U7_EUMVA|nr:hypothetical protein EVAR_47907_1 [Eumeta japonica]